jgi:hypothetical protein
MGEIPISWPAALLEITVPFPRLMATCPSALVL